MDPKPAKPDKKLVAPIKELDAAIAKSRKTKADSKALEAASKEKKAADKALGIALNDSYRAFDEAYRLTCPLLAGKGGPVPVPYPEIAKARKSTENALKKLQKARRGHEKTNATLVKVVDKELQVLQSEVKMSSGDEAGTSTLQGLVSAKRMSEARYTMASGAVTAQGSDVQRHWNSVDKALKKAGKTKGK